MNIENNLDSVKNRILSACKIANRDSKEITLIAVSKFQSVDKIETAINLGQQHFGENYLQEAINKIQYFKNISSQNSNQNSKKIFWHFIGDIQSNKTKQIAENFDFVHSVNRLKIAQRLNNQRPINELGKLKILIEINVDNEITKSGLDYQKEEEILQLCEEILLLENLQLCGFMCIPPATDDEQLQKLYCQRLAHLLNNVNAKLSLSLKDLSMGMSNDLEAAICSNATMVRIGTAIFGERQKSKN